MIKVRLQCSPRGTYAGPWDCLKRTVQSEGPRALYKGPFVRSENREMGQTFQRGEEHHRKGGADSLCAVTGATPPAFGWTLSDSLLMVRSPSSSRFNSWRFLDRRGLTHLAFPVLTFVSRRVHYTKFVYVPSPLARQSSTDSVTHNSRSTELRSRGWSRVGRPGGETTGRARTKPARPTWSNSVFRVTLYVCLYFS